MHINLAERSQKHDAADKLYKVEEKNIETLTKSQK